MDDLTRLQRFDYQDAFSRNIGWVTEREQQALRCRKVAIAGSGGVGGAHLLTLARMGIGRFSVTDFDHFEVANINRQVGAFMSTVGQPKVDIMAQMARDINPEIDLSIFGDGIHEGNIDQFLDGADLFVDGFDFFAMDIRRAVFKRCEELSIPAVTAAPIGLGSAYLIFLPGRMGFEEYFQLDGLTELQQYANFFIGLTPKALHRKYLVDPTRLDLATRRGPSTSAGIQLCAGVVGAEALKILLGRGNIYAAPWYHHFDAYRVMWKRGYLPLGNANPLQRVKRYIGEKSFETITKNAWPVDKPVLENDIERILHMARWAPSGDNSQPWRFEVLNNNSVAVVISIEGTENNVYDFNDGQPTLLSAGMLVETIRIVASTFGLAVDWRITDSGKSHRRIEIDFTADRTAAPDELFRFIQTRSVDRRPYQTTPLGDTQKDVLTAALGDGLSIRWFESDQERQEIAAINAVATDIRLRIPEAFRIHRKIVDWDSRYSQTGIPANAIGLAKPVLKMMRWSMKKWARVDRMNKLPSATAVAQKQLDLLPGQNCAAHFSVTLADPGAFDRNGRDETLIQAGQALQKFWLTAEGLGLVLQPSLAPICFANYAHRGIAFTADQSMIGNARKLEANIRRVFAVEPDQLLFLGRIGYAQPSPQIGRSIRRPLARLMEDRATT